MQKNEFLKQVQAKIDGGGMPLSRVDETVRAVFDTIAEAIQRRDSVSIHEFGTFSAHLRQERTARNPKTKEEIPVPAKYVPKFKASSILSKRVAE